MTMPRFSVLIPTRDRPDTFRHTLATVLAQPGDDYEIVVADNCSGPETRRTVETLSAPNVRYLRSDEILPMTANWERGLSACTGEYVTVLGDDDALVASALPMARKVIAATEAEIISWTPHTYWWPDTIVTWLRNVLIVLPGNGADWLDSRSTLLGFYRGEIGFDRIPMIYQAFFHRALIEDARQRFDAFFAPPDTAPDLSSGILGLHLTERFVHSTRALSIRGNSGKSNGTAQWARSLGARQREIYFREERIGLEGIIHKSLVPSPNLQIVVASALLKCKEAYFPDDEALILDFQGLLRGMLAQLTTDPDAYDDNLRDIRALAAKLGVVLKPEDIPAKAPVDRKRVWGPVLDEEGKLSRLRMNGELARVSDIAGAASLVEAVMPPAESYLAG